MSVYVSPLYASQGKIPSWRWKQHCHLYAHTLEELHAAAEYLGLARSSFVRWLRIPHYDLTATNRVNAIRAGAIEHTQEEFRAFIQARLEAP